MWNFAERKKFGYEDVECSFLILYSGGQSEQGQNEQVFVLPGLLLPSRDYQNRLQSSVIRRLPPPCPEKSNRKRKLGKAEILTSTPIKTEQLKKLNTSNAKVKKLPKEMTNKGKQTGARMRKQRKKNANDREKGDILRNMRRIIRENKRKTQRRLDHVQ
ncbi:hypothetical protein NQ318_010911 [Aromia moschata]|uniref:Uncharacterized protein n=1 Tax=Aromia moschata TaxID=1265417 RepID=A0AAV8XEQ4_9CUCU|nr:hypothetical protein NQ318_010911 [Aromia moschata]